VSGWSAKLSKPVYPRGSAPLYTLADAREHIAKLPKRTTGRSPWRETIGLLQAAAGDGSPATIAHATQSLKLAVFREYRANLTPLNVTKRKQHRSPKRSKRPQLKAG
jgi:hypothetical protein